MKTKTTKTRTYSLAPSKSKSLDAYPLIKRINNHYSRIALLFTSIKTLFSLSPEAATFRLHQSTSKLYQSIEFLKALYNYVAL